MSVEGHRELLHRAAVVAAIAAGHCSHEFLLIGPVVFLLFEEVAVAVAADGIGVVGEAVRLGREADSGV